MPNAACAVCRAACTLIDYNPLPNLAKKLHLALQTGLSQLEPVLVTSRLISSAWLKLAQFGWLSHFKLSCGNTSRRYAYQSSSSLEDEGSHKHPRSSSLILSSQHIPSIIIFPCAYVFIGLCVSCLHLHVMLPGGSFFPTGFFNTPALSTSWENPPSMPRGISRLVMCTPSHLWGCVVFRCVAPA